MKTTLNRIHSMKTRGSDSEIPWLKRYFSKTISKDS